MNKVLIKENNNNKKKKTTQKPGKLESRWDSWSKQINLEVGLRYGKFKDSLSYKRSLSQKTKSNQTKIQKSHREWM